MAPVSQVNPDQIERMLAKPYRFHHVPAFDAPNAEQQFTDNADLATDASAFNSLLHQAMTGDRFRNVRKRMSEEDEREAVTRHDYARFRAERERVAVEGGDQSRSDELVRWHDRAIAIRNRIACEWIPIVLSYVGGRSRFVQHDMCDLFGDVMRRVLYQAGRYVNKPGAPLSVFVWADIKQQFHQSVMKYDRQGITGLRGLTLQRIDVHSASETDGEWLMDSYRYDNSVAEQREKEKADDVRDQLVELFRDRRAGLSMDEHIAVLYRYRLRDGANRRDSNNLQSIARKIGGTVRYAYRCLKTALLKLRHALLGVADSSQNKHVVRIPLQPGKTKIDTLLGDDDRQAFARYALNNHPSADKAQQWLATQGLSMNVERVRLWLHRNGLLPKQLTA